MVYLFSVCDHNHECLFYFIYFDSISFIVLSKNTESSSSTSEYQFQVLSVIPLTNLFFQLIVFLYIILPTYHYHHFRLLTYQDGFWLKFFKYFIYFFFWNIKLYFTIDSFTFFDFEKSSKYSVKSF